MKFKPLADKVIIKTIEEKISDTIIIPDTARERPILGKVLAVGVGLDSHYKSGAEMEVKVGDTVLFPKYEGLAFKYKGEEYLSIPQHKIMVVCESSN